MLGKNQLVAKVNNWAASRRVSAGNLGEIFEAYIRGYKGEEEEEEEEGGLGLFTHRVDIRGAYDVRLTH